MVDDHEDYLEEGAAVAHHETHEDEGTDEISLAGLSGEPEDLAAHILLPTVHQDAPELIETHRLVSGAHHARYTNGEAVAAMGAKADVNPLHHDKAAEWGATEHTAIGDAAPHHAKYTNAEAVTAMGAKADGNPLHHDKAAEWGATEHTAIGDAAPHHAKYTDANAVTAMGAKADGNPLHHDKAAEWGATEHTAIGDAAPHHAKYTDDEAEAVADAQILTHKGDADAHHAFSESTWTPVIEFGGAHAGQTYSTQSGKYTRIGNIIYAFALTILTEKGTSTGIATLGGLPFTNNDTIGAPALIWLHSVSFTGQYGAYLAPERNYLNIQQLSEAGTISNLNQNNFTDISRIYATIIYTV